MKIIYHVETCFCFLIEFYFPGGGVCLGADPVTKPCPSSLRGWILHRSSSCYQTRLPFLLKSDHTNECNILHKSVSVIRSVCLPYLHMSKP